MAGSLRVVAIKPGFYGFRRRYPDDSDKPGAGLPFTLKSKDDFSSKWMKWVDGEPDGKAVAKAAPAAEPKPKHEPASAQAAKAAAAAEGELQETAPPGAGKRPNDDSEI